MLVDLFDDVPIYLLDAGTQQQIPGMGDARQLCMLKTFYPSLSWLLTFTQTTYSERYIWSRTH